MTLEGSIDDLSGAGDGAGGGFDLVLCHNVLHYRPAETGAADVRRPGAGGAAGRSGLGDGAEPRGAGDRAAGA
ncbi:hypothetical protein [Nocardioides marinisabuli]|uniref:hypothetical protein n=1 Tax=Nocardioides marinisabuli TaxID=419476 RepID=UPI0015DDF2B2|nr:hypothetical protein [Nocardioides marinisabuli]